MYLFKNVKATEYDGLQGILTYTEIDTRPEIEKNRIVNTSMTAYNRTETGGGGRVLVTFLRYTEILHSTHLYSYNLFQLPLPSNANINKV